MFDAPGVRSRTVLSKGIAKIGERAACVKALPSRKESGRTPNSDARGYGFVVVCCSEVLVEWALSSVRTGIFLSGRGGTAQEEAACVPPNVMR